MRRRSLAILSVVASALVALVLALLLGRSEAGSVGAVVPPTSADALPVAVRPAEREDVSEEPVDDGVVRVRLRPAARLSSPEDEPVFVGEVRAGQGTTLVVRDAETGLELSEVTVLEFAEWFRARWGHPGIVTSEFVLVEGERSPVRLPARPYRGHKQVTLLVHNPGYAWSRLEVNPLREAERQVLMKRGGSLRVLLDGAQPVDDPPESKRPTNHESRKRPAREMLRLREEGEFHPYLELPVRGRAEIVIEDLRAGAYDVSVELGSLPTNVRGSDSAIIRAGEVSEIALVLPAEKIERVPLAGVLVVPPEWNYDWLSFSVELQDPPTFGQVELLHFSSDELVLTDPHQGHYAWEAGMVQPGRYELSHSPSNYQALVVVGEAGSTNERLEVPPPGRVSLQVVEATNGFPADLDQISWYPAWPEGIHGGKGEVVSLDPITARCAFRATQGPIVVSTSGPLYEWTRTDVDVAAEGVTEVVVNVRRRYGILIRLLDGETVVPWGQDWDVEVGRDGGEPGPTGFLHHPRGRLLHLDHPGLHRLRFATAEGFLPIPDHEVRLDERGIVELVIHLKRVL